MITNDTDIIYTSFDRGVKPLYDYYKIYNNKNTGDLKLIDKVIGNGAALLCILIGIIEVHTDVISKSALKTFKKNNIPVTYTILADQIMNRNKDGRCPVEMLSEQYDTPEALYHELKKFFKE